MNHPNPQKYLEMEDNKITNLDNEYGTALSEQDLVSADTNSATVPYTEYLALRQRFLREKQKMEDQIWLDQALIRFNEVLKECAQQDTSLFAESILHHLAKLVNAVYGAFFMVEQVTQQVTAVAGYACTLETMARTEFKIGEGLIGQVAKTKEIICLENIETQLDSSLGRISATTLMIAPMVLDKQVLGILELNTLTKAEPRIIQLLEKVSYHTALMLHQLRYPNVGQAAVDKAAYQDILNQLSQKEEELKQLQAQLSEKQHQVENNPPRFSPEKEEALYNALEEAKQLLQEKEEQLKQLETQLLAVQTQDNETSHNIQLATLEQALTEAQERLLMQQTEAQETQTELESTQQKLNELLNTVSKENADLIATLEAQLSELNTQLEDINLQNEQLKNEIQRRGTEYDMLKEAIKWKDAEIDRQDEVLLERKKVLQNVEKEKELIQAENLKQVEEIVKQGKALKAKEAEIEILLAKIEEGVPSEQLTEVQNILVQKEHELAQIQQELQEKKSELENTTERLQALEGELVQKNQEIEELQQTIQNHSEQLEIQTEKLSNILTKLRKKEDELLVSQYLLNQQQTTSENAEIINTLRNQILSKEDEIKTLQAQIQAKVQHFNDTYQALQTHLEAQNNANIEVLQAEIDALKTQLNQQIPSTDTSALEEEVDRLKEGIIQKNDEIIYLKEQLENQQLIFEDNDLGSLQEKLSERENEIRLMKEGSQLQVEALEALKAELAQKEARLEALNEYTEESIENEELSQTLQELQRKEQELLQQSEVLSNLRNQLLEKEKTIEQLKKQIIPNAEIDANELAAFQQKLEDLERIHQDLKSKEEEIAKHTEIIRAQKGEILEKHQLLESLREEIKLKEQENLKQQAQIQSQQEQLLARQEELSQKERELTGLFNKINTAFAALEFDMNGRILSINNKFLMLLGRKLQEVEGQVLNLVIAESFRKSMDYVLLWEGLKMGVTQTIEQFTCLANKEREIQMSVTFIPILDNQGRPYEVVLLVNQVYNTEPNSSEKPQEDTQSGTSSFSNDEVSQKLKALDTHFILMELDTEGKIIDINQQFMRCLGYEKEDVIGKTHKSILDVTDRTMSSYENTMKNLHSGEFSSEILKYLGKEGERVRLKSHFNPMLDEAQVHTKTLVISQFLN